MKLLFPVFLLLLPFFTLAQNSTSRLRTNRPAPEWFQKASAGTVITLAISLIILGLVVTVYFYRKYRKR